VRVLADVGLEFVFLLAGYEIDLWLFREDAGRRALVAWAVSLGLATVAVSGLAAAGMVQAFLPVALGLTTTALGTVLPVLREEGTCTRQPAGRRSFRTTRSAGDPGAGVPRPPGAGPR
jgi:Kef-type K+ transport system membrane component KefB